MTERSRGWCFTINNYTNDDIADFMCLEEHYAYGICGFEEGEETHTPHMQCYVYGRNQTFRTHLQKLVPRAHIEAQHGTKIQALTYCMEDLHYYEFGKRPQQGKRTDLDVIKHELLVGKSSKDISLDYFSRWVQYRRAFDEFIDIHRPVKFVTKAYYFDEDQYEELYTIFDDKRDRILYTSLEDNNFEVLMHAIHSKRYRYVFVPISMYKLYRDRLYGKISQLHI